MNLNHAIEAHTKWKVRLRTFLNGGGEQLDPAVVERDDQCDLGRWIHGEGKSLATSPSFQKVVQSHAQFHRCAAKVVRAAMTGRKAEAEQLLSPAGEFSTASQSTIVAIQALAKSTAA